MEDIRRDAGITIVETMIVLAIAGLILLVVFLAIPGLQRSSRNGQRKQDVQTILGAVSHYELNDSGKFPDDCGGSAPHFCKDTSGGSTPNDFFLRFSANDLTFYTADQVIAYVQSTNPADLNHAADRGPSTDENKVYVYNYELCNQTGGGASFQAAGYSDVVALYALESGNGSTGTPQCQQL